MTVNDDITISKGAYSVTLFTGESTENIKNTLNSNPSPTTYSNQSGGYQKTRVVDLLKITRTFEFDCYICPTATKTAKQIKDELKKICTGADVDSTTTTLTYEDETITCFIEDCVIKKILNDNVAESGYTEKDNAEYRVTLTILEGRLVGEEDEF